MDLEAAVENKLVGFSVILFLCCLHSYLACAANSISVMLHVLLPSDALLKNMNQIGMQNHPWKDKLGCVKQLQSQDSPAGVKASR
ncbi:hypothetical protein ACET3Z_013160 [Daucus carota]